MNPARNAALRTASLALAASLAGQPALSAPTIVPGPVDQLGPTAGFLDLIKPHDFVVLVRGADFLEGNLAVGRERIDSSIILPDPPEFEFFEDRTHAPALSPVTKISGQPSPGTEVDSTAPSLAPVFSDEDLAAAAFTRRGSAADKMEVAFLQLSLDGGPAQVITFEVDSLGFPDSQVHSVDVVQDELDLMTAVFTEITESGPQVKAQRVDWNTAALTESLDVDLGSVDPEVALLDPRGDRLVVAYRDFSSGAPGASKIQTRILDTTGPTPVLLPEFQVNSTAPIFGMIDPSVAADVNTGQFVVAWTDLTGVSGNPADIRARRFDAAGNPVGLDFVVNTTTANTQDQAQVDFGPGGIWAVTWAGDDAGTESLDVYFQVFDRDGAPLGSETRANAGLAAETDRQDHPTVRFLPFPDAEGRPQFAVAWRDTADTGGAGGDPNDSGTAGRCFSIDGLEAQSIFSDGFESGDLAAWSGSVP